MHKASHYYPELDGLRFLAFLLVLVHHSPYAESVPAWGVLHDYGWMGVELFFCLSAYLFAKLLFVEYQEEHKINVPYFYLRRTLRIWPLYFFFVSMMLAYTVSLDGWQRDILIRSAGLYTFTDNLLNMRYGYNLVVVYCAHLWTISYEEQFYLVIPWALQRLYRLKSSTTFGILGAGILLSMAMRAVLIYYKVWHPSIWVFPLTHCESIFGGLMLGLGLFDKLFAKISSWMLFLVGAIALGLVTSLPNVDAITWKLMLTYPLVGAGASLILAAATKGGLGPLSMLLRYSAVGYLGKISYGLYVYHIVGISLAQHVTAAVVSADQLLASAVVTFTSALAVTILISALSYQLLEKPFLRLKDRFTFIQSRPI